MQKIEFSSPAVEAVYNEVKELLEKQSMGYKLVAKVGKKPYFCKRIMGCGEEIWFTPKGNQWRKADIVMAVRPTVPHAENVWEQGEERPRNFRRSIRRPDWMSRRVDENTLTEDWLSDWDVYTSQYDD